MNPYTKEYFDALKARHPFPGGWRKHTRPTKAENAAASSYDRTRRRNEGTLPSFMYDAIDLVMGPSFEPGPHDIAAREAQTVILDGVLFVSKRWIIQTLTEGWNASAFTSFMWHHKEVERRKLHGVVWYYRASSVVRALNVMPKTLYRPVIRGSVSIALQGSGSINDKLLAFAQNGACSEAQQEKST